MSSDIPVANMPDKRDILALVREIEKYPYLYNINMPEYVNRTITMRAWTEIAKTVDSTVRECKNKWRKTRIAFMRSLKLMKRGTPPCRPYYLADYLQFIVPFIKLRDDNEDQEISQANKAAYDRLEIKKSRSDGTESDDNTDNGNDDEYSVFTSNYDDDDEGNSLKRKRTDSIENNPRKMFLLSILPDVESLTEDEMRKFRRDVFVSINNIIGARGSRS